MLIALDYDGTYTADPMLWDMFILNARLTGHTVYCITMRFAEGNSGEAEEVKNALEGKVDKIIFTNRQAKKPFMIKHFNQCPDVWIDDMPEFITEPAQLTLPKHNG